MGIAVFDTVTLKVQEWIENENQVPPVRANLVNVVTPTPPDAVTQRYDGAGGIRAATRLELDTDIQAARDAAKSLYSEESRIEQRGMGDVDRKLYNDLIDKINDLRALSIISLPPHSHKTRRDIQDEYEASMDDLAL